MTLPLILATWALASAAVGIRLGLFVAHADRALGISSSSHADIV